MIRAKRNPKLLEFVPPSQLVTDGDSTSTPDDAAVYVFRDLRRREYTRIVDLIRRGSNSDGDFDLTLESAYEVAGAVLDSVRNFIVMEDDGKEVSLELRRGDDGMVLGDDLDLLDPADVFAFGLHVLRSAKLGADQGEK